MKLTANSRPETVARELARRVGVAERAEERARSSLYKAEIAKDAADQRAKQADEEVTTRRGRLRDAVEAAEHARAELAAQREQHYAGTVG